MCLYVVKGAKTRVNQPYGRHKAPNITYCIHINLRKHLPNH